jgi:hypothetical protein
MAMRNWIAIACLLIVACASGRAQQKKPLTNSDVVEMVKAGLDEPTILMAIQVSPSQFDLSVQALINLKSQNVSETLIRAMLAAGNPKSGPVRSAESAAPLPAPHGLVPHFMSFPVQFYAEQFAMLGANATPVSQAKVYVGKSKLRFVSTTPNDPSSPMIIDPLKPAAYVVSPGKSVEVKTVFQGVLGSPAMTAGISMYLLPADPENPCENWATVICTRMGAETIEGRSTTKWDLTHRFEDASWHTYVWIDVRLHFVTKRRFLENTFEFRNIVEGPQESGLFDVP